MRIFYFDKTFFLFTLYKRKLKNDSQQVLTIVKMPENLSMENPTDIEQKKVVKISEYLWVFKILSISKMKKNHFKFFVLVRKRNVDQVLKCFSVVFNLYTIHPARVCTIFLVHSFTRCLRCAVCFFFFFQFYIKCDFVM